MDTSLSEPIAQTTHRPLLRVENLKTHLTLKRGVVKAVDGVNLEVGEGETLGIVGESGSGKTMTCLSILRLLPRTGEQSITGRIDLDGTNLLELSEEEMARDWRGRRISMVSQDPLTSLNPVFTVGDQVGGALPLSPPRPRTGGGARRRRQGAAARPHPLARHPARRLSASVLRRHAPARLFRHGDRLHAAPADRRRADQQSRRHDPGPDDGTVSRHSARDRRRHHPDHPRPRRGGRHLPPHRGDVCGPGGGDGRRTHRLSPAGAPLYARPARFHSASGPASAPALFHRRPAAQPDRSADGLPLRRPLPEGYKTGAGRNIRPRWSCRAATAPPAGFLWRRHERGAARDPGPEEAFQGARRPPPQRRHRARGRWRQLLHHRGRNIRPGRRIRLREDHHCQDGADARSANRRRDPLRRP